MRGHQAEEVTRFSQLGQGLGNPAHTKPKSDSINEDPRPAKSSEAKSVVRILDLERSIHSPTETPMSNLAMDSTFLNSTLAPATAQAAEAESLSREERSGRELTKVFKALSDGTRQKILNLLEDRARNVGEIVSEFDLSQPTISRHLSVLKEADLVVDQRQGQNVVYRLNNQALTTSMQRFFSRFSSCQSALR